MPVRKIPRSYRNVTGRYSFPGGTSVAFESLLERDFLYLMDFDPRAVHVEGQPVKVPVPEGKGRAAYYVPDFLVQRDDGPAWLVEVKPLEELEAEAELYRLKFKAAHIYAEENKWVFKTFTDKDIRTPRLKNIRFLISYRNRTDIVHGLCARIMRCLEQQGHATITELAQLGSGADYDRCLVCVWHLLSTSKIEADLMVGLQMDTSVRLTVGDTHGG